MEELHKFSKLDRHRSTSYFFIWNLKVCA